MFFEDTYSNFLFILVMIALIILVSLATIRFSKFKRELDYINGEIERTDGGEQRYWKIEKRRLIFAFIFFRSIQ
ncbi:MAG: hypothetical protein J6K88_02950 [Oscillospiraceae bacterium]|nr:hypothetical protein [Oscillospiraceae bacterium]